MNCKPGDLAVVVRVRSTGNLWALGRVVRCESYEQIDGEDGWNVEGRIHTPHGIDYAWVADHCLSPIRPDGITDEEVRELYAPKLPEIA